MRIKNIAVAAVIATQTLGLAAMPVSAKSLPKMTRTQKKQLMDINIDTSQELCLTQNYQGIVVGVPEIFRNGKLIRLKKDNDIGTYVDTNVRNGKKYTYARKGKGGKKSSKSYTIYRVATPKIVSMKKKGNKMTVKWTKVPGATSYTVSTGFLTGGAEKTVDGNKTSATFTVRKPQNYHKSGKTKGGESYETSVNTPTDYSLLTVGATKKVRGKKYNGGYAGRYFWL